MTENKNKSIISCFVVIDVGVPSDNTHAHPGAKSGDALRFSEFSMTAGMHNERRTRAPN